MEFLQTLQSMGANLLVTIPAFLFVLTVIVFIHEFGHFWVARRCGVRIETFSIGFGREIWGRTDRHGTRWKVGWIPLGGYVKFWGDENAASIPDREKLKELAEEMGEDYDQSFHFKPVWQRALVVAAGPAANFILAIVIFSTLFLTLGEEIRMPRLGTVEPDSIADQAGFQPGDIIVKVNGERVKRFRDVELKIGLGVGTPMTFTVERDGELVDVTATPQQREVFDPFGNKVKTGYLGLVPDFGPAKIQRVADGSPAQDAGFKPGDVIVEAGGKSIRSFFELQEIVSPSAGVPLQFVVEREGARLSLSVTPEEVTVNEGQENETKQGRIGIVADTRNNLIYLEYGPLGAVQRGVESTFAIVTSTFEFLGGIFAGRQSADQIGGPLRIAQLSGQAATSGPGGSLNITALINVIAFVSVAVGLVNLFPIPVLDGGHLLFYAYEAVAGRPLGEKMQEFGFRIGLAAVLGLMIFAMWNDLTHFGLFDWVRDLFQ